MEIVHVANDWMDYPDLAVGNTFLYVSVDKMVNNAGLIVARIPLNQLTAAGTINIGYTKASDIDGRPTAPISRKILAIRCFGRDTMPRTS